MMASTATDDSPLRQTWPLMIHGQTGGLTALSVDILFLDAFLLRGSTRPSRHPSPSLPIPPHSMGRGRMGALRTLMNSVGLML